MSAYSLRLLMGLLCSAGTLTPCVADGLDLSKAVQPPEIWINVGGFSRHFSNAQRYNENNVGFGVELRTSSDMSFMAGAYANSMSKTTHYAAVNWQPWTVGPAKLGAAIGFLNGYPAVSRGGTFFAALPMASIEGRRFGVNLGVIPSVKKVDGAVIVQFKLRLN